MTELTEAEMDDIMSYLTSVLPQARHHVEKREADISDITPTGES